MTTIYTVNQKALRLLADQIQRDATRSLSAWILAGQGEKYPSAMEDARLLREAASEKSVATRREILSLRFDIARI